MRADAFLAKLDKVRSTGKARRQLPSLDYLGECFHLDTATGMLIWRERPAGHFFSPGFAKGWNRRYAGRKADVAGGQGYWLVCVDGVRFKSHRVVFAMANNVDPGEMDIDHINRKRSDNRPENLRLATNSENTVNLGGARADNTHGGRGVSWKERNKKWQAWAQKDGVKFYLGIFKEKSDALAVAESKRKELYGEFYA